MSSDAGFFETFIQFICT